MAVYRGCTLLLNGFQLSDTVSYTPPELKITEKWFRAGNMNAPVPVDTGMEPMTAVFRIAGMSEGTYVLFGMVPGVRARLTVRRVYRDEQSIDYLEDQVEGFISSIRPDEHGNGDRTEVGKVITVSVSYYSVAINGLIPILEINPVLGLRKIMSINVLELPDNLISAAKGFIGGV
ncbi:phage major tail tube protein [Enterobacter mori]